MNMQMAIQPKSDQINADDLIAGPLTVTVAEVVIKAGEDQPVSIKLAGEKKVFRPCKSMSRVMVAMWGPDAKQYAGRSLTLYRDPSVKWGGMEVGGIRISHMSHIDKAATMALTATRGNRKPYTVKPLADAPKQASQAEQAASDTPEHVAKLNAAAKPWGIKFRDAPTQAAVNELLADPDWQELMQELEQHSTEMLARIAKHFTKES